MKSVLISIRPKWVEKILSGEKAVEVRKTAPKIATPFKCYIYCTKGNTDRVPSRIWWKADKTGFQHILNGKVIGEFVCDAIMDCRDVNMDDTCISIKEWLEYTKNHNGIVYGWHISEPKIYDKPLDVRQFVVEGDCDCLNCRKCFWRDPGNGYNVEDDCNLVYEYLGTGKTLKPLFRPPQSWCYVEEKKEAEKR